MLNPLEKGKFKRIDESTKLFAPHQELLSGISCDMYLEQLKMITGHLGFCNIRHVQTSTLMFQW